MDKTDINRIILIGNGFDLSHDLKTSYKDFIDNFWEQKNAIFIKSYKNSGLKEFSNNFIRTSSGYKYEDSDFIFEIPLDNFHFDLDRFDQNLIGYNKLCTLASHLGSNIKIKNSFLEKISKKQLINWVDIEEEYYSSLLECLVYPIEKIKKLNNEFEAIKKALEDYLNKEVKREIIKYSYAEYIFYSLLSQDDFIIDVNETDGLKNILYLNFNYTPTLNMYIKEDIPTRIINIHGILNSEDNPIIFGYGDEIDEKYKDIEKEKNDFLKNIKSINYSQNNNYRNMLRYIDSGAFQVFIVGHSCGLSDRTLLNTIFEHENCKSIKIFYYKDKDGYDNYNDTYMNLSRNFKNKQKMREIVISKESTFPYYSALV